MKKVMMALAVAAMMGANAELCDEVLGPQSGCALYNVKFSFKTLAGKDAKCKAADLAAQACLQIDPQLATKGIAYLDNATRTFDGILWQCKSVCFEGVAPGANPGVQPAANGPINYILWEKKTETAISPLLRYTAPTADAPANWATDDESLKFDILGRYGAKADKVAAYWKPSINATLAGVSIDAAGFGTFDVKQKIIKSVSGNAVAKLIPTTVTGQGTTCSDGSEMVTVLAYMCTTFKSWCCCTCVSTAIAPASGTWSIKYNASASKSGKLSKIVPDYMIQ